MENEINRHPPEWHADYLREREVALASGEDEFVDLDEFESDLRQICVDICDPKIF